MIEGLSKLVEATITPDEARGLLNQWVDYELGRSGEDWGMMPLKQWLAKVSSEAAGQGGANLGEVDMNRRLLDALGGAS